MNSTLRAAFVPGALRPIHPLHAMLLAFALPMFFTALLSDLAYASNYHVQWINFASWLIVGGLVGGGFALAWALIDVALDHTARSPRYAILILVMLAMWVLSFVNALVHAKDAWATMPAGLWLSLFATLLAILASWIGFAGLRAGETE